MNLRVRNLTTKAEKKQELINVNKLQIKRVSHESKEWNYSDKSPPMEKRVMGITYALNVSELSFVKKGQDSIL